MASSAICAAGSCVCSIKAVAAAVAYGPPLPMAAMPESGSITSPCPLIRNVWLWSATSSSASS